MNLMNYHLYANTTALPQIMAEDTGAAELRNPVYYIRTEYRYGKIQMLCGRLAKRWHAFWNVQEQKAVYPEMACLLCQGMKGSC